ncbi:MAG TPA: trehalose-phosphatase [Stellaceae bacterium]|nr:trehalose-phosphatase [Stellaceae bacterium]
MRRPGDGANRDAATLPAPPVLERGHALFLDFDGTLVDIAAKPDLVRVGPELPRLLNTLSEWLGGALSILSGRPVDELARLLAPFAGVIVGQHGLERRSADGIVTQLSVTPTLQAIRAMLADFAAQTDGVSLEDKGATLSLHFREAPARAAKCRAIARRAVDVSGGAVDITEGKMVIELVPEGGGKGGAIAGLLVEPPFKGRIPVFVGDDSADEEGFRVIHRLGGISVHVGDGVTAAGYRLATVGDVKSWLAAFLQD